MFYLHNTIKTNYMRKHVQILSALFLSVISVDSYSQPTINENECYYQIGANYSLNICNYIAPGPAGANVTWDYSNASAYTTAALLVEAPSTTSYGSSFSTSTACLTVPVQNTYQYFTGNGSLNYTGAVGNGTVIAYSDPEKFLEFPIQFGASLIDQFESNFISSGFSWLRTGTVSSLVDGYGTLITPAGTYTDVLRVKIVEAYSDYCADLSFINYYDNEMYHYYKAGGHYPLAFSSYADFAGTIVESFQYVDVNVGIKEANLLAETSVYPNPAQNIININNHNFETIQYSFADVFGRIVLEGTVNSSTLELSELPNGIYSLTLIDSNGKKSYSKVQVLK